MSFITKRERVFNEYDLFDLPARNEGKLKAYASCTDARAWSHFCSDKSEHLVEIIKRNNETVRPKYIPTDVIVNTLMTAKNAEIARLKRKIGEFEQMLSAYDQLDLTCDQKCDIANAHAVIKAANKELDDMCLDLDLSGFTEGIDSEAFETGKSRGDEPSRYIEEPSKYIEEVISKGNETEKSGGDELKLPGDEWTFEKEKESTPRKETKSCQAGSSCTCDASTSAHDTQVEEMQETIISKDAKLSAMQNTIAVMEHDVCEPYCIYAHIYTALEKIFATLCQNGKYKQYLDLLTAGKDTRLIDIKGKILFKMKVLEKFSLALIAPCSQDFSRASQDCSCYRAEVVTHVETTFALTSAENQKPSLDNKRAQLVADIMENQEMREILSKESLCLKIEDDQFDECFGIDHYCINAENLNRLKNLQANYDELLNCYDNLKYERDSLYLQCKQFADLENECDCLKNNLKEYNQLWKEKEFFKRRSEDLDTLKENYFVLSEETSIIESKLRAEQEINKMKSESIDELKTENIRLEQKIGDTSVLFEKQKNVLICKLKECECKIMCQEQQIKSLSIQIDKLLEQDKEKIPSNEDTIRSVQLIDQIESQKEQILNLKDALYCSQEEKQYLQEEFEKKLQVINELKLDVEDWKSKYEKAVQSNNYLEKYLDEVDMQVKDLRDKNLLMNHELESKTNEIENLNNIICSKSREMRNLMEELEHKKSKNMDLIDQMTTARDSFDKSINLLTNERKTAMDSIVTARQQSIEHFKSFRDHIDDQIGKSTQSKLVSVSSNYDVDKRIHITEPKTNDQNIDNINLIKEIDLLHGTNFDNMNILMYENLQLKKSLDLAKKESQILEQKLVSQENMVQRFEKLKQSHDNLLSEKENLLHDFQLTKKDSENLLDESKNIKEEYFKLKRLYQTVASEINNLQKKMFDKDMEIKNLRLETERLRLQGQTIQELEKTVVEVHNKYDTLLFEKTALQKDYDNKIDELNNLYNNLENKIEDNQQLQNHIKILQSQAMSASGNISILKNENYDMQLNLSAVKKESAKLLDKIQYYENIENEYNELKLSYNKKKLEKDNLLKDLNSNLEKLRQENNELINQNKNYELTNQNLMLHSENLEKALISARDENLSKTGSLKDFYSDVKKEIESLKEEKFVNNKKLKSLMEKLDESEYFITNLTEHLYARDRKISTLENHINELEEEIRALQNNLVKVVESGEQLKQLSSEQLDQSIKKMEAHQSKATHNMKIELAKLKNQKQDLEYQLSSTKLITKESFEEKNKYILQINQLKNEREVIISDIKHLEIKSIGDSNLSPSNCSINDVITSLDRVGKYLESKNTSLEETLLKIRASYQLLKSKADEAKNIAEKERQKIINEKEQTRKEIIDIEKQLNNLKAKMKDEKLHYEKIINDYEGETLNQTLIFDEMKQSKESRISKLLEDNELLRGQCTSSLIEIEELKEKLKHTSEQQLRNLDMINKTNTALEEKNKLFVALHKQLEDLKNKPTQQCGIQTIPFVPENNKCCQTDLYEYKPFTEKALSCDEIVSDNLKIVSRNVEKFPELDISKDENPQRSHKFSDILPLGPPMNEVQILTANVEPTIDFVKNIYFKYKINRLSPGKLEQYSIASLDDIKNTNDNEQVTSPRDDVYSEAQIHRNTVRNNDSIIDIYNTGFSTNSMKITDIYTNLSNKEHKSPLPNIENINVGFKSSSKIYPEECKSNRNESFQSKETDLFVIYKDSDSIYDEQSVVKQLNDTQALVSKNPKKYSHYRNEKTKQMRTIETNFEEKLDIGEKVSNDEDDDSIKPILEITLPRVINNSPSTLTTTDCDRKSLDSYRDDVYNSSKREVHSETNIINKNTSSRNEIEELFMEKKSVKKYVKSRSPNGIKLNRTKIIKNAKKNNIDHNSNHQLSRIGANVLLLQNTVNDFIDLEPTEDFNVKSNYGLQYILNTVQNEINPRNIKKKNLTEQLRKSHSDNRFDNISQSSPLKISSVEYRTTSTYSPIITKSVSERGTLVKMDAIEDYENQIQLLTKALENIEKDYKKKIEAVKLQYDSNVKSIINEHNHGVQSIQNLHEETLHDIIKIHENEVENLRTMSIEAMRKAEKLETENRCLKSKLHDSATINLDEEPIKIPSPELKKRKCRCRLNNKTLTKTNVEAFNVKPKLRSHGPCTCSLDRNISDTIRNIFEQVDVEQRKMAEQAYLKYIANKILDGNVETLDAQELSFLHLKVCRTWKTKLNKEEALQKKIDLLENEVMNKQRKTQKHMAELDRKVAEEWRRLQEVREAVCRTSPAESRDSSPGSPTSPFNAPEKDICNCNTVSYNVAVRERQSAGDLTTGLLGIPAGWKRKRAKLENNRAVLAKLDNHPVEARREKGPVCDETPTRLKRAHDRHNRIHKK